MAGGRLDTLIRYLRRGAVGRPAGELTDADLLDRFLQGRDEAAFELLVWRHGAMVLNVCRRVLRREHDAEDAFQAAFLALACKAGSIGRRASVGSWLYKVAYRAALRARTTPSPALAEDPPDPGAPEPLVGLLRHELRSVLDDEIHRLPERYRAPFVLCHLEGKTTTAAARALGWPRGTVGTRLRKARELLRARLARRGYDLSVLAAAGLAVAAPRAALAAATVRAALLGPLESAVAAGVIAARVPALAKGALRTMSLIRWTSTAAVALALGLLGGGAYLAHCPWSASASR